MRGTANSIILTVDRYVVCISLYSSGPPIGLIAGGLRSMGMFECTVSRCSNMTSRNWVGPMKGLCLQSNYYIIQDLM